MEVAVTQERPTQSRLRGVANGNISSTAKTMHVTALPNRLGQNLPDRRLQPGVIVRNHEFNPEKSALPQAKQKLPPARPALAVGTLHGQDLPPAFAIDRNRDQNRLARDHAALAHPFITGIENKMG
jgi:hypothetical protein